ncbi:hypothetical protein [Mycolicibacter virginiensis]|uniref:Uncharacterized protein n=2 Tax=Mycolicibacter TaxID=1073531 RepID=A0A9X7NZQ6_9MYCO|nr:MULTISPECIES: hypothetical protein [Mycobacteriaceae]OBJ32184.1 hypothetical protein A5631_10265 [Mycolicibacter heraklionensis]PQM53348.1 hypothetical protein C5U48_05020 [Mycolicibacter virginiensis]ULP48180.1 hypothetical protein MJO54_03185 [Mycolicibacter virginiensis]
MPPGDSPPTGRYRVEENARPHWLRTGYRFFPYAAQQSDQWWVLRFNFGFPEHEMYTLFVDGNPATDVTGNPASPAPLIASIGALRPSDSETDESTLDPDTAARVVKAVAPYADYGSEYGAPCVFCSGDRDGMTLG